MRPTFMILIQIHVISVCSTNCTTCEDEADNCLECAEGWGVLDGVCLRTYSLFTTLCIPIRSLS